MGSNNKPNYSSFHNQSSSSSSSTPQQQHHGHHANDNEDDVEEDNGNDLTPQQVERIYSQLNTKVRPVDKSSGTYNQILQYARNVPLDKEYFVDVKDAFSAISLDTNGKFKSDQRLLLWFGIRLSSVAAILIRGLRPTINDITEWKNLIFYDIVLPAAEKAYMFSNKKGFIKNKGVLMLCEVSFNDMLEIDSATLVKDLVPPSDGTIIKLCGKYSPSGNSTLNGVPCPLAKIRTNQDVDVIPCGNYNQYIVTDPAQIRIKYIVIAECRTNNTGFKPTKDFFSVPHAPSNTSTYPSSSSSSSTSTSTSTHSNSNSNSNNNTNNNSNKNRTPVSIKSYFTKIKESEKKPKPDETEQKEQNDDDELTDEDEPLKKNTASEKNKGKQASVSSHYYSPPSPSPPSSPPHSPPRSPPAKTTYHSSPSSPSSPPAPSSSSSSKPTASPTSKKEVKHKIWQYFTHGGWRDFAAEHNTNVNKNSENKRKFEMDINDTTYTIDTTNGVQYQTNDPTKRRKIRVKPQ